MRSCKDDPWRVRETEHYVGGFNIMRFGAGPNGPMRTLGQYMLVSGSTFGYVLTHPPNFMKKTAAQDIAILILFGCRFFMSIGSVIRTEAHSPYITEAYARARRQPMILPRRYMRRPDGIEKE